MKNRKARFVRGLFSLILLALVFAGCGLNTGAASVRPQAGDWKAEFSTKTGGGQEWHWILGFTVSGDGKTVSSLQLAHYVGELTSKTNVTVLFSMGNDEIKNNSFSLSFSDYYSYTSHSYKGNVTFVAEDAAEGTINISGEDYRWKVAPASRYTPSKAGGVGSGGAGIAGFISNCYLIAYGMAFPAGIALFILAYKSLSVSGARGASLFGAPLLAVFLALAPLLILQEAKSAVVFTWAFFILLIIKAVIGILAYRFEFGHLWAARKLYMIGFCLASLISAA